MYFTTIQNSSWVYFLQNLLSWVRIRIRNHFTSWIRIRIQKNCRNRIRKKWMRIHSPAFICKSLDRIRIQVCKRVFLDPIYLIQIHLASTITMYIVQYVADMIIWSTQTASWPKFQLHRVVRILDTSPTHIALNLKYIPGRFK